MKQQKKAEHTLQMTIKRNYKNDKDSQDLGQNYREPKVLCFTASSNLTVHSNATLGFYFLVKGTMYMS